MAASLTLTDSTTVAAPRAPRRANPQSQLFQQFAEDWAGMTGLQKASWNALAQNTADALQPKAAPAKITAYTAFVSANTALINSAQGTLTTAPSVHVFPPALPPLTLEATFGTGGLSLVVSAGAGYSDRVLLYAARPQLSGRAIYPTTNYVLVGSIFGMSATEDITDNYLSKFRIPGAGYQIAMKIAPVSTTGYRRQPVLVSAVVTAAPAGPLKLK